MNTTTPSRNSYPDCFNSPSAHRFGGIWDSVAVARIIHANSVTGRSPAFLYLGAEESGLLRKHLGDAFGEEAVSTLHETYYMGLKVVVVDAERYIGTGGSKESRTVQAPGFRRAS